MPISHEHEKRQHICIFCQTWESGGIESFIYNALCHMDISRFRVDLVVEELRESIYTEPLKQIGVLFFELSGSVRHVQQNYQQFSALMNNRKYDVIHLNVFQAQALMYLSLAKKEGIPVRIAHSHNTMLRVSLTKPIKMLIHKLSVQLFTKDATDWWACSKSAAQFMFTSNILGNEMWKLIPDGIDLQRFRFNKDERERMRAELQLEDHFVIGNVGRLCYQKNQAFLLELFAVLHSKDPKSALLLVGEGKDEQRLREQAKRLGITDGVVFYGVSQHVEQLLWAMDVFAFPSRFEGFGIVAVEAQAAGLPVICSDSLPTEAIVTEQAKQIPLNDKDAWVSEILNKKIWRRTTVQHPKLCDYDIQEVGTLIGNKYSQKIDRVHMR